MQRTWISCNQMTRMGEGDLYSKQMTDVHNVCYATAKFVWYIQNMEANLFCLFTRFLSLNNSFRWNLIWTFYFKIEQQISLWFLSIQFYVEVFSNLLFLKKNSSYIKPVQRNIKYRHTYSVYFKNFSISYSLYLSNTLQGDKSIYYRLSLSKQICVCKNVK